MITTSTTTRDSGVTVHENASAYYVCYILIGDLNAVAVEVERLMSEFKCSEYLTQVIARYDKKNGKVEWVVQRMKHKQSTDEHTEFLRKTIAAVSIFVLIIFWLLFVKSSLGIFE